MTPFSRVAGLLTFETVAPFNEGSVWVTVSSSEGGMSIPIDWQVQDYPGMYAQEQAQNQGVNPADCTAIAQWQDDKQGWVQRTGPQGDCYDGTWVYPTKASDRGD